MNREELKAVLDNTPAYVDLPDSKATEQIQDLLKHPGLPHLWGLLLGARQAQYAALQYAPLGNMAEVARAAVIQGTITGIELFYNTVIEQSVPSRAGEQEQEQR